jgi:hypothetical protein
VVLQAPTAFRLADLALTVLVLAVFLLVLSVQCGFVAAQYTTTPREIDEWWVTMPPDQRWRRIRREQWRAQANARTWGDGARYAYAAGVTSLWVGVALALVPPDAVRPGRLVAVGLAAAAALFEIGWAVVVSLPGRWSPTLGRGLTAFSGSTKRAGPPPERWEKAAGIEPYR